MQKPRSFSTTELLLLAAIATLGLLLLGLAVYFYLKPLFSLLQ